jgi:hypothetical protein
MAEAETNLVASLRPIQVVRYRHGKRPLVWKVGAGHRREFWDWRGPGGEIGCARRTSRADRQTRTAACELTHKTARRIVSASKCWPPILRRVVPRRLVTSAAEMLFRPGHRHEFSHPAPGGLHPDGLANHTPHSSNCRFPDVYQSIQLFVSRTAQIAGRVFPSLS